MHSNQKIDVCAVVNTHTLISSFFRQREYRNTQGRGMDRWGLSIKSHFPVEISAGRSRLQLLDGIHEFRKQSESRDIFEGGKFCHGFWSIFTDPWFLQHTIIKEASWKPPNENSLWECSIEAIWRLNLAWLLAQVLIRGDFHSTKLRKGSPEKIALISNWVATKY